MYEIMFRNAQGVVGTIKAQVSSVPEVDSHVAHFLDKPGNDVELDNGVIVDKRGIVGYDVRRLV